jgi:ADP-ribose pyrophosphatase
MTDVRDVRIEVVEDRTQTARCDEGFVRVRRYRLVNVLPDGTRSVPYPYDVVDRRHMDAVAVVLVDPSPPEPHIVLRLALRPPLWFRGDHALPFAEPRRRAHALELPAGLIEDAEKGPGGIAACASRETREEAGLLVPPDRFEALGPPVLLSPGLLAEKVHLLAALVDLGGARERLQPDGPVEEAGDVVVLPWSEVLRRLDAGELDDAKTEIGLRRSMPRLAAWTAPQ